MGVAGFGHGGGFRSGPRHTWYATDYTPLYKGLAVVGGFFLSIVLFLLLVSIITCLRRRCCPSVSKAGHLKKRRILSGRPTVHTVSPIAAHADAESGIKPAGTPRFSKGAVLSAGLVNPMQTSKPLIELATPVAPPPPSQTEPTVPKSSPESRSATVSPKVSPTVSPIVSPTMSPTISPISSPKMSTTISPISSPKMSPKAVSKLALFPPATQRPVSRSSFSVAPTPKEDQAKGAPTQKNRPSV